MEDSLILQLSGCSPSTPSPQPRNTCRLVPLLGTPAKAPDFVHSNKSFQKTATSSVLHGVVAYIDVRSESDNRSRAVGHELEQLGATVVDRFTDDVTHFVYKDGKKRTLDMALRRKVHLVSVLWVESCKQNQRKVPEDEFHITLPKKQTPIGAVKFKRYKSMQPKSFDEEVVLSEEKLRRRLQRKDKMGKFRMMHTPEPNRLQNFFVAETCRRSPTTDELVSPMSICVPDTPPSMRRHLAKSQSARRASYAVQSPRSSLSLNPVQRKFLFDENDSSPEGISVSSGSHPLSRSSQGDCHSSIIAPAQSVVNGSRTTASGSAVQSASTVKPAHTESISPEIELQTTKPFPHFVNSGSSLELEKKETDSNWMSKTADSKLKNSDFKSSPAKPEFETLSKQALMSPSIRQMTLGLQSTRIKRKHSPSLEEETAFSTKRSRINENSSNDRQSERVPPVSLIPLSQLKSETPQASPTAIQKRIRLEQKNMNATQNSCLHLNSENLSANNCSEQDVSPKIQPRSLRSFVHSSPTSSQEASRSRKNGTLLPSHDLPAESHTRNIKQHLMEITPVVNGFHLAKFERPDIQHCATPCNRPLTCADSLVLETRVQKRRSLMPFHNVLKSDGKLISRRKTLTNGDPELETVCSDSATNGISPSKVILQRLPGAWDKSKSSDSSNSTSISRKVLSENIVIQQDAKSKNSINTVASPVAKKTKRDDTDVGSSPVRKSTGRSTSSGSNQGTNSAEKEKRNNDERRARKVGRQKVKKSSSISSTESIARCSQTSVVITSLHRDEQKVVKDIIQKLGSCVLSEEVNEQTTHVVSGGNRRTVKVLAGICRGLWILSLDWVKNSAKRGRWLPEEQFELTDFFPAAKMSRLKKERLGSDYRHDLFSKVGDIFVADGSAPPKEDLEHLVTACQGKVTKQLRTAKICVGKFLRHSITNVSEKWILDCITQHECLSTTDYVLNA